MEQPEPNKSVYGKINVLIAESTEFLSKFMQDFDNFEQRAQIAEQLFRSTTDVKHPDAIYRPFSAFDPI